MFQRSEVQWHELKGPPRRPAQTAAAVSVAMQENMILTAEEQRVFVGTWPVL